MAPSPRTKRYVQNTVQVVLGRFKEIPRLAVLFVLCLGGGVMSVEGYTDCLVYFKAWYYVPSGYGFDICGEYVDLRAVQGFLFYSARADLEGKL